MNYVIRFFHNAHQILEWDSETSFITPNVGDSLTLLGYDIEIGGERIIDFFVKEIRHSFIKEKNVHTIRIALDIDETRGISDNFKD